MYEYKVGKPSGADRMTQIEVIQEHRIVVGKIEN